MTSALPTLATTPEQRELAALARAAGQRAADAAGAEPAPGDTAAEDAAARRALAALAADGLTARSVPAGSSEALSVRDLCVIRQELAHASGLADVMFAMQGLGSCAIALAGPPSLRARYLPAAARGQAIAAIAMTEPQAGSDLAAVATRATRDNGGYRLDGTKTFISNAGLADFYTLFARTGEPGSGRRGLSAFVVDASNPGLRTAQRLTVSAPHPIGTLELAGCRVPASCRLGEEGEGYDIALRVLHRFRPTVGAAATGFARRALMEAVARARIRVQFGHPLADLQAIRFKLADMATWLEAAQLLVMRAADVIDEAPAGHASPTARRASAMAKLYATEAAQRIVDEALQIHGGLGVTRGQVVERLYREVRALRIYEGTSEIQRSIIAHTLLKETS